MFGLIVLRRPLRRFFLKHITDSISNHKLQQISTRFSSYRNLHPYEAIPDSRPDETPDSDPTSDQNRADGVKLRFNNSYGSSQC